MFALLFRQAASVLANDIGQPSLDVFRLLGRQLDAVVPLQMGMM